MAGQPGRYRHAGVDYRPELGWALGATVVPVEPKTEGVLDRGPRRPALSARICGQSIDVRRSEPGVFDSRDGGVDGQVEHVPVEPSTYLGGADARKHCAPFAYESAHAVA
jgi:hypothetical protein